MSCLKKGAKKGSDNEPFKRQKDFALSPENIVVGVKYATTWNPCDKRQYFDDVKRIDKLKAYTETVLLEIPNVKIELDMEVSKKGRLHWHGTIMFTTVQSIKHFYVIQIHNLHELWNIDIDTISNEEGWHTYCTKQKFILDEHVSTNECLKKYRAVKVDKNGIMHKNYFTELINDAERI